MPGKRAQWISDFMFKTASGVNKIPCPGKVRKDGGTGVPDYDALARMADTLCPYDDND